MTVFQQQRGRVVQKTISKHLVFNLVRRPSKHIKGLCFPHTHANLKNIQFNSKLHRKGHTNVAMPDNVSLNF